MRSGRTTRGRLAAATALACVVVACALGERRPDAPPQGWWAERGPVVPHDSFPADCRLCHEGEGWHAIREDFAFDHEAETGVALLGPHAEAECLRCHNDRGPVARFAARGCAGCHEDVHRGQLGADCEACHDPALSTWEPRGVIAMHDRTRFPLVGAHASTACWRCHPGALVGEFTRLDTDCVACHRDDWLATSDPDHQEVGFGTDCATCHLPTSWGRAGFAHGFFPLTGAHGALGCAACHAGGTFGGTPTSCEACHLDDWLGTRDPDHQALGFPTTCDLCHDTGSWEGADFDHAGIASGCVACHLDDWQATTEPSHAAAGFPTTCEQCHDTRSWQGASFDHPFPIGPGPHGALSCADCHPNPRSFRQFTCTACHEHAQDDMADEHDDVPGYVWESGACLACHPSGRE